MGLEFTKLAKKNELFLNLKPPIARYVANVNLLARLNDVGMLFEEEPANVREEKASLRIVGIAVAIAELVMHTMIANPIDDRILRSRRLKHE